MLRSVNELIGYDIAAINGEIGDVDDFFFDDRDWAIRYLVADTGGWLTSRLVLLSPNSLEQPDWSRKVFPVRLTKEQVEKSPNVSKDKPVSRQNEIDLANYYQWPLYWNAGMAYIPMANYMVGRTEVDNESFNADRKREAQGDPHLRSSKEVMGYNIQATDKEIGHVEDFILEDEILVIRYMVVDTRNWLPGGKKVLISPFWVKKIDWTESKVYVDLPHEMIKESPEYDPSLPISREYEEGLYKYYNKTKYWK